MKNDRMSMRPFFCFFVRCISLQYQRIRGISCNPARCDAVRGIGPVYFGTASTARTGGVQGTGPHNPARRDAVRNNLPGPARFRAPARRGSGYRPPQPGPVRQEIK